MKGGAIGAASNGSDFGHGDPRWIGIPLRSISRPAVRRALALGLLQRGVVEIEPMTAEVLPLRCVACGLCVEVCPASAIELVGTRPFQMVAEINPALCKGCGVCVGACPACPEHSRGEQRRRACRGGAITLHGFTDQQLLAQLSSLLMPEMAVG